MCDCVCVQTTVGSVYQNSSEQLECQGQMGGRHLCVHWCTHRHCNTQLPSSPPPPPLQMTSILFEQLCTLADGSMLMYSVADRDRYLLHQQLMGAGSGCTVTNSIQEDIPSVPVECAVCFAHPVTHVCSWLIGWHNTVGDTRQTSVCCTVLSLLVWQY